MIGENMPDLPEDFRFEPLLRAKVDDQRAGFEQCRDKVMEFVRRRVVNIEQDPGHYTLYDSGQLDAFQAVLVFLSTQSTEQSPPVS